MLVIRRRAGEVLLIGEDVEIEILDVASSHVKIGIRAPKSVQVIRKEIRITRDQNLISARESTATAIERLAESLKKPLSSPISPL